MRHKGIRPTYDIQMLDFKRKIYCEEYPNGGYRIWNKRLLKSGCGVSTNVVKELLGCYYCPTCKEYFNKEQWETDEHRGNRSDRQIPSPT